MKRRNFIGISGGAIAGAMLPQAAPALNKNNMTVVSKRKIVAYGAGHNPPFIKFVASLTEKKEHGYAISDCLCRWSGRHHSLGMAYALSLMAGLCSKHVHHSYEQKDSREVF